MVGYSHVVHATMAPVGMIFQTIHYCSSQVLWWDMIGVPLFFSSILNTTF